MFEKIKSEVLKTGANVYKIVLVQDSVRLEETLRPSSPCLNCYSLSKNFTATAVGIALDKGLLSLDDPIVKFFPHKLPAAMDDKMKLVTVRHLLTQTMGNGEGYLFEDDRYTHGTDDWVRLILSKPLQHTPGEKFTYSNTTYYLLSCIIHSVSGVTMDAFLRQHLFKPMDINAFAWETCPMGETMGATGLYMATSDIVKLGLLYLQKGTYNGKQLLSRQWCEAAVVKQTASTEAVRYGYSFWLNDFGYNGGGAFNQIILVVPDRNLVFAAHSYTNDPCDFAAIVKGCL